MDQQSAQPALEVVPIFGPSAAARRTPSAQRWPFALVTNSGLQGGPAPPGLEVLAPPVAPRRVQPLAGQHDRGGVVARSVRETLSAFCGAFCPTRRQDRSDRLRPAP